MTNTEELAVALAEKYTTVSYDPEHNSGYAYVPPVGHIKFREAGSDPAVIIEVTHPNRFKGTSETALQFLKRLSKAWGNSD